MSIHLSSQLNKVAAALQTEQPTMTKSARTAGVEFSSALTEALSKAGALPASASSATAAASLMRLEMLRDSLLDDNPDESRAELPSMSNIRLPRPDVSQVSQKYVHEAEVSEIRPAVRTAPDHKRLERVIDEAARHHGVEPALVKAVIRAESGFDHRAVSKAGARGLMQLMPDTAKDLGVANSFDAHQNVMAGTRYLKKLLDRYDGHLDAALAAYNWGPGNVDRKGLASLPEETRTYLARVKMYYSDYAAA